MTRKIAFVCAANVRAAATDAQTMAFDGDFEVFAFHPASSTLMTRPVSVA